jgi:hypothetical protein
MNVRRDKGVSLILAALRGFCLLIFSIHTAGLPAKETARDLYPALRQILAPGIHEQSGLAEKCSAEDLYK